VKKLVVPQFATEKEEAQWWDGQMQSVEDNLVAAIESGTAQRGTARKLAAGSREPKEPSGAS
jgi:hypothetical protein